MGDESQISATISAATKEKLDRFADSHGLKKNFVVEQDCCSLWRLAGSYLTKRSSLHVSCWTTRRSIAWSPCSRALPPRRRRFAR